MSALTEKATATRLTIPVTVLLERRMISRGRWQLPVWGVSGVLVGEQLSHQGARGQLVRTDDATSADPVRIYSWSGYQVTLYKDAAERYWHALIGDKPLVYVLCRDANCDAGNDAASDEAGVAPELEPALVTIDYDDALAFAETDQEVLSAPIPGELYRAMEAFVLQHYRPKPFTKRKRRNWTEEAGSRQKQS